MQSLKQKEHHKKLRPSTSKILHFTFAHATKAEGIVLKIIDYNFRKLNCSSDEVLS